MKLNIPNFESKSERNAYLVKHKKSLIETKKMQVKECDVIDLPTQSSVAKKITNKADEDGTLYRTIVGNTYNWLDSHGDVHLKGIFTKSISERGDKVRHLHDHIYQLTAKVGDNQGVYEKDFTWEDLGVPGGGTTTALIMETAIKEKLNPQIYEMYKNGEIDQHSVGMQYVKIDMALDDPEYKEEYAVWESTIDLIKNRDEAEKEGMYFVVREAKLIEISCVIAGSNPITPTLESKAQMDELYEVLEDLEKSEATDKEKFLHLCKNIHALRKGEPLIKTLDKKEPQGKSIVEYLIKQQ